MTATITPEALVTTAAEAASQSRRPRKVTTACDGLITWREDEDTITIHTPDPITLTGKQAAQLADVIMDAAPGEDVVLRMGQVGILAFMAHLKRQDRESPRQ